VDTSCFSHQCHYRRLGIHNLASRYCRMYSPLFNLLIATWELNDHGTSSDGLMVSGCCDRSSTPYCCPDTRSFWTASCRLFAWLSSTSQYLSSLLDGNTFLRLSTNSPQGPSQRKQSPFKSIKWSLASLSFTSLWVCPRPSVFLSLMSVPPPPTPLNTHPCSVRMTPVARRFPCFFISFVAS
jgi:hypothetical protein